VKVFLVPGRADVRKASTVHLGLRANILKILEKVFCSNNFHPLNLVFNIISKYV
jgi:hypothetical protein